MLLREACTAFEGALTSQLLHAPPGSPRISLARRLQGLKDLLKAEVQAPLEASLLADSARLLPHIFSRVQALLPPAPAAIKAP